MFHRGWFLVAGKDPCACEQTMSVVRRFGVARLEACESDKVLELVGDPRWAGAIISHDRDLISSVRKAAPLLPILGLLDVFELRHVNTLQTQQVEVVAWPCAEANVVAFVQGALATGFLPDDRVSRLVRFLAAERGLTAREVQLLSFSLGNEPRARVRRRLGVSENTLKTQIRGLLRKCGERSLDALAKNVLRAAVIGERQPGGHEPVAPWFVRDALVCA